MEPPSPARLYATAIGALLLVLGIVGFAYSASFGSPGEVAGALGVLRVNGWLNCLYVAVGTAGLLAAGTSPRPYSIAVGSLFTGLAIWGWTLGPGQAILGFLPAEDGDEALALLIGLLGLAAARGTVKGRSKARTEAAGQRP